MNIKLEWAVLSKTSIIDKDTSMATLIDCIEKLTIDSGDKQILEDVNKVKTIPIAHEINCLFSREKFSKREEFKIRVNLIDPVQATSQTIEGKGNFAENDFNARVRFRFGNFLIKRPGFYHYKIKIKSEKSKWTTAGNLKFHVNFGKI